MAKKLTTTIARALAEKVRQELKKHTEKLSNDTKAKVAASKEHKEYMRLVKQTDELNAKRNALCKSIEAKFSTDIMHISLYSSGNISVYDGSKSSVDGIRDLILIEDYLSDGTETAEQLVDKLVKKLLKN